MQGAIDVERQKHATCYVEILRNIVGDRCTTETRRLGLGMYPREARKERGKASGT